MLPCSPVKAGRFDNLWNPPVLHGHSIVQTCRRSLLIKEPAGFMREYFPLLHFGERLLDKTHSVKDQPREAVFSRPDLCFHVFHFLSDFDLDG